MNALPQLSEINRTSLPPEMIIDDYIENYKNISCEDYLTEFVNSSSLFLKLSSGQTYTHTPISQQNNKECDCRSDLYELDFKRLGTQSSLYAKRNLSLQKYCLAEGVVATTFPRQSKGMEVTLTNGLLMRYSLDDLLRIDNSATPKFNRNKVSPESDVKSILEVVKCDKNTLFFYTDFIFSNGDFSCDDIILSVEPYLNGCFSNLFRFRDKFVPNKDTYFTVIVQGFLCLAIWYDNTIQFKEYIPLSKSPTFLELCGMISSAYTSKLKLGDK